MVEERFYIRFLEAGWIKALSALLIILHVFTFTFDGMSFAEEDGDAIESSGAEDTEAFPQAMPLGAMQMSSLSMSSGPGGEPYSSPVTAIQNFHADPSTGMAATSVPISVPPGRRNMQPDISLNYSSSSRNSWVGFGWMLDMGHIERSTKDGIPGYTDNDTFYFVLQGVSSELVHIGGNEYRAKIESGFLRFVFEGSSWVITDKSGAQYHFGSTSDSCLTNSSGTFQWFLDKVVDTHGNYVTFSYYHDSSNGQVYLERIDYTGNENTGAAPTNAIEFTLEAAQRTDVVSDYGSGYRIATTRRLKEIITKVNGSLASKYAFEYKYSPRTGRSLLSKVTKYGRDGVSSLPATVFMYSDTEEPVFTYRYTEPSQGDHLWNARHAGGYDRGHENYGPVPPPGFDVVWGPTYAQSSYSESGWSFNITASGSLFFSSAQDSASHFWTYLYVNSAKTLDVPFTIANGGCIGIYLNGDYANALSRSWNLKAGYNLVEITGYHQHDGYNFDLNFALADNVNVMNSFNFSIPQLSADFNSDGITDLGSYINSSGDWKIALSNGVNFEPEQIWISGFGETAVPLLGDFNADGKIDVCSFNQAQGDWRVALSDGASFNNDGEWLSSFGANEKPISGDFNGDSRVDVGYFDEDTGNWYVALSNGFYFDNEGIWLSGFGAGKSYLVGDFNGDSLTDVAYFDKTSGTWYVALCNGSGFISQGSAWATGFGAGYDAAVLDYNGDGLTDIGYFDKTNAKVVVSRCTGTGFTGTKDWISGLTVSDNDSMLQIGDYNGDGLIDPFLYNPYTQRTQQGISGGKAPDLLTQINNGFGASLLIHYAPSSAYDNTGDDEIADIPFVFQTIKDTTLQDGMGNSYKTSYHYEGAFYDTDKKDFQGFSYVKITDTEGNFTETYFNQGEVLKGKPRFTEARDKDNNLYTRTDFTWLSVSPYFGVDFPYLYESVNYVYDGDSSYKKTGAAYEYDDYGNVTKVTEEGDYDVTGDERQSVTEYVYNIEDWIVGLPSHAYVLDSEDNKVSEKWLYYDNNLWWTNAPEKGRLTKEEAWLNPPDTKISSAYTYDDYGNLVSTVDSMGRTTRTEYETAYHAFPKKIINVLGHTVEYTYDPKTGQVLTAEDPNSQITETVYDTFGRPVKVIGPNDTIALPSAAYEYDFTAFPGKVTKYARVVSGASDVLTSHSFFDGLGRTLQLKTEAEDASKQILSGLVEYDARSLVKKQYLPYLTAKTSGYTTPDYTNLPYAEFEYDPLGRVTKAINPDKSFSITKYSDWSVTETDENDNDVVRTSDAYGNLVEVNEYNEGETYTTTYSYDSLGNLIKVIDNQGNITEIFYDSLGRKISMDDPDMGEWSYEYDAVGNLVRQTDAKSQAINFRYDALNRLILKDYASGTDVNYIYDSGIPNSVGRLTMISDQSGSTEFFYDNLGREIKTIKTVSGTAYTVEREYDALDRLHSIKYPDNETVYYTYNRQGGIDNVHSSLRTYVANADYNALGQMTYIEYGNGTHTDYEYDLETTRLKNLKTNDGALQDLGYTFDQAGNVTWIQDDVNTATQEFMYDGLNRLIQASGSYGTIGYEYDSIGNLKRNGAVTFNYGENGAGPHAVTSSSTGKTFGYDANGNMVSRSGQGLEYDYENRLKSITGLANIEIHLEPGWNFISIPIAPEDPSIENVLSGLTFGIDYDQISRYNPETAKFEHYVANSKFNDFDTLEYGRGYQIHVINSSGCDLSLSGSTPKAGQTLQLKQGWNLIGSPTTSQVPVSQALSNLKLGIDYDEVVWYNPITGTFESNITHFEKGKSYALHCLRDVTWNITQESGNAAFLYDGDGGRVKRTMPAGGDTANTSVISITPTEYTNASASSDWTANPDGSIYALWDSWLDYAVDFGDVDSNVTLKLSAKNESSCGVPPEYTHFEVEVYVDSVYKGLLSIPYSAAEYKDASIALGKLKGSHTIRIAWVNDYWVPDQYDANIQIGNIQFILDEVIYSAVSTTYIGSLYEKDSTGAQTKHIFLGANRIASVSSESISYYHSDHIGSSNVITDEDGGQVQFLEYTPYGTASRNEGTRDTDYRFTGKQLDESAGLYFYGARYYDPELGRFITADSTIQRPYDPQDLNRYSYCRNNPINYADPSGLGWKSFWKKAERFFKNEVLPPVISFTVAFILSAGNFIAATSVALATATLDTGEGRQIIRRTANDVFDDIFGMRPSTAYIWSNMVCHAVLASIYYIGLTTLSAQPYAGPDYTKPENQAEMSKYAIDKAHQPGGSSANWIAEHGGESQWYPQGRVSSDIAFNDTPILGKVLGALNARHAAAVVNVGGRLIDSAKDVALNVPLRGRIYGSPWTGISHQAFFRKLIEGGMTGTEALGAATSHAGWSFYLSSSIYGVEGHFGAVGIVNAELNMRR